MSSSRRRTLLSLTGLSLMLAGCSGMQLEDFSSQQPELRLEEYFVGETRAWGIFEDRFGNLKRSFTVDITGTLNNGMLKLDERFLYNDGETDQRIWNITVKENGNYEGQAADVVGTAQGRVAGNALNWQYELNLPVGQRIWKVHFNDWMFLQSDGVLINKAKVTKWGIHLGTVTLFFQKQP